MDLGLASVVSVQCATETGNNIARQGSTLNVGMALHKYSGRHRRQVRVCAGGHFG